MGRITETSIAADHEQQAHAIQPESNLQNEVVEYDQNEQQIPTTTSFYQANPTPTTAFSPANPPPTTSFSPANPPPTTPFYQAQANTHSTMPTFFSPSNTQQFISCPPPQAGYSHSCGAPVGGNCVHNQHPAAVQPQATESTVGEIEPTMGIPVRNELWTTGLFDCWEDPFNALITAFLPCVTYGQIAEIIDNGQSSCAFNAMLYICILHFIGLPCLISCTKRTQMRNQYGLVELPAPDWIIHLCCESCALCQEYRELQNRGVDPSLGWAQNVARRQVVMMPPINQRMMGR